MFNISIPIFATDGEREVLISEITIEILASIMYVENEILETDEDFDDLCEVLEISNSFK